MSDKPLITVMILSYNYGELLKKALEAIRKQTFSNYEVLMINNGSTDNTEEVFLKFQEENPEISTTYLPFSFNQGIVKAWNEALKHANGTYVMLHDADDWMEPACLEKLAKKALETGADRVTGAYQEVSSDGTILRVRGFTKNPPKIPTTMQQGTIFRLDIIENYALYCPEKIHYAHDVWLIVCFAAYEGSSSLVEDVIYNYYFNPKSVTQTTDCSVKVFFEELMACSEGRKRTNNVQLQTEMEYLGIRHCFAAVLKRFIYGTYQDANCFYQEIRENLKKYFPNYQKNKLIWPLHNGYEFAGSFACAVLCLLDRLRMMWLIAILAKAFKHNKMFREKL